MRPQSIRRFEQVYVAAILIGIVQIAVSWGPLNAQMATALAAAPNLPAGFGATMLGIGYGVSLLIQLLLLFFIARRGSDVARWIYVILFALALLAIVRSIGQPNPLGLAPRILSIIGFVLQLIGLVLLFRPDAKAWFSRNRA